MTKIIDFYFDLISPFSYLAHVKLPALANRYDRKIIYHPIDIPSAKIAAGNYGPSNREVKPKIKVMLADLQRWAKRYEAPFAFPKNLDCELWNRVAVYAEENGKAREFVRGAYHAIWGEGGDPTDLERLRAVADEAGLDGEIALAWAQSPEGSARFKRSCVDAHSRGIFGAPIMVADEEFFWGNDRLDFLEEYLASVQQKPGISNLKGSTTLLMIMPRYLISILDTGESFECDDETSILKAMVTIGRKGIPSGCHGGGCGICKVKIAEGEYHCGVMSRAHVTVEEQTDGYALSCRVFPRSAISVEVIGLMRRNFLRSVDIQKTDYQESAILLRQLPPSVAVIQQSDVG